MYNAYDFTFAGVPASTYGLALCDIDNKKHNANAFGNVANIVDERVYGRIKPLHFGVNYHEKPLTFHLIFASERYLDRYDMQKVAMWLTGHQQYQWLTIHQPDMAHIQFRCLIQKLTPIHVGWLPVAFEAEIVCDCPYGYSFPFKETLSPGTTTFFNDSTCHETLRPSIKIDVAAGCTSLSITNKSNGNKVFSFTDLPGGALTILVDNENCIIEETKQGLDGIYDYFDFQNGFLELVPGDNELVVSGDVSIEITGRFMYNVGA